MEKWNPESTKQTSLKNLEGRLIERKPELCSQHTALSSSNILIHDLVRKHFIRCVTWNKGSVILSHQNQEYKM